MLKHAGVLPLAWKQNYLQKLKPNVRNPPPALFSNFQYRKKCLQIKLETFSSNLLKKSIWKATKFLDLEKISFSGKTSFAQVSSESKKAWLRGGHGGSNGGALEFPGSIPVSFVLLKFRNNLDPRHWQPDFDFLITDLPVAKVLYQHDVGTETDILAMLWSGAFNPMLPL